MSLSTNPYKGARDFYPEDKRLQKYIFSVWRKVSEQFGYEEYDAPIIEPLELYLAKTGEEIVTNETYLFQDRGGREVVIRPEMTPTVSRMVAGKRQELAYPLRWYSIPNVWRYERPQRGRLREHWQLNIDVFGIGNRVAEHEIILLSDRIMQEFGADRKMYTVRLNSRKFTDFMLTGFLKVSETQAQTLTKLIDRMKKIEPTHLRGMVDAVMNPSQRLDGVTEKLLNVLQANSIDDLPGQLAKHESINELTGLMGLLDEAGITNAVFDPSLVRGFDYYTDVVFEVYDAHPDNNRSMFGGGRYDGLVGLFGVEPVPTVGCAMGDVTLQNFLKLHGLLPKLKPETDVQILLIGEVYQQSQAVISELRGSGLNVAVDSSGRKLEKQLKNALKRNVRYLLFIGEEELKNGQFNLKDTLANKEEKHSLERIISIISDFRRREPAGKEDSDLLD